MVGVGREIPGEERPLAPPMPLRKRQEREVTARDRRITVVHDGPEPGRTESLSHERCGRGVL